MEVAAAGSSLLAASLLVERSQLRTIYRKVKGRLRTERGTGPLPSVQPVQLPPDGERVSAELALNSRCSSDYDGDPDIFHWGMFNPAARLSGDQVRRIAALANRCRFSEQGSGVKAVNDTLTFSVDKPSLRNRRENCMIENGMQQQAVSLACAALGVGTIFDSLGLDGQELPSGDIATLRMRLGAMKPSYRGSYWTASVPQGERPWLPGNLPDPRRDGTNPLIPILSDLSFDVHQGAPITRQSLSQLLWAARGRTPHLYKSTPWGLTIPTWQGLQNISAVYAVAGSKVYKYGNWLQGRPTHSLETIAADTSLVGRMRDLFAPWNAFVILATDDSYSRGLWEVGYQLLNVLVQASGLGTAYQAILLRDDHRARLAGLPTETPVAIVALRAVDAIMP
ncbi:MAG: hypothetical protein LAP87_00860 [Acidobacteriia bacterium]|nr:hypothetical protein [Terriglobia bacterium]